MTDYSITKHRIVQWLGIILIIGVFAGAYWYFRVYAGYKTNVSPTGALTSGLVNYWTFDGADVSGTTATDRGSGGNNGTLTSGPTVTQGKLGQALDFDGTNDYVDAGDTIYSDAFTVCAWVKADVIDANSRNIVVKRNTPGVTAGSNEWTLNVSTSGVTFTTWTGASTTALSITGSTVPSTNTWYHLCGVEQGNGLTGYIYMDGVQNGSATQTAALWDTADRVQVGARSASNDNRYWNGQIDEVRIYSRALSATEVQSLYKLGASDPINSGTSQAQGGSRLSSGLAGYWAMDNGSGTSVTDSSTNGNTGTLTGGSSWGTGQIGSAVDLDGTDDYVDMDDLFYSDAFTVCAWVRPDVIDANSRTIVTKRNTSGVTQGSAEWTLHASTSGFAFVTWLDAGTATLNITSSIVPTTATWYHVCGVQNGTGKTGYVYVNGNQNGSATQGAVMWNTASRVQIGARSANLDNRYWNGLTDEVRVYNRGLSADEVADLYRLSTPTAVDTGLKGYWSFNGKDVSGTAASDRSGVGATGTLTNGPVVTPGKVGQAIDFDGSNDYVSVADNAALDIGDTNDLTLSGWFNRDTSTTYDMVLTKRSGTASNEVGYLAYIDANDTFIFEVSDGTDEYSMASTTTFTTPGWHHFAVVWDQDSASGSGIYLDGVADQVTKTGTIANIGDLSNALALVIGAEADLGNPFDGKLDEIRMYNRILTASEIQAQYAAGQSDEVNTGASQPQGVGRLDSGLAGYWPLDEGTGTSIADGSTSGNTGTLTNSPAWTTGQIGSALSFTSASSQYGNATAPTALSSASVFSVSFWASAASYQTNAVGVSLRIGAGDSTNLFMLYPYDTLGGNGPRVWFSSASVIDVNTAPVAADGTFHLFTYVQRSATNRELYVDGISVATNATSKTLPAVTNFTLGSWDGTQQFFSGKLDDVRLYSRALSIDEVSRLYRLTTPTGVDTGLKGYWSFNGQDVSGVTVYDRSGVGNIGTTSGSPAVAPGKIGQGIALDGSDDYVSIADANSIDYDYNQDFSFSLWVKLPTTQADTSAGDNFILEKWSGSGGYSYVLRAYNQTYGTVGDRGKVYFRRYDGTNNPIVVSTSALNDNAWHHVVGTKSGSTLRIYVDGASQATATDTTTTTTTNTSPLYIGTRGGSTNNLTGVVDEVRLYNRVLTAAEVASLYNTGK